MASIAASDAGAVLDIKSPGTVGEIVLAAYDAIADAEPGTTWDEYNPIIGASALDAATIHRCVRLGSLIGHAGQHEESAGPEVQYAGPVVGFTGADMEIDLIYGEPERDTRIASDIVEGLEALGCTVTLQEGATPV